ncbi:uncharacterized protein AMSG_08249 [Thecamonas trahens ATCC 50062]|uniref:CAP-Gly domain-containing protein n=1 Tax=Thecamonas trahens ATCC 50062 TaxID=461836 RepID=A0A0L0DI63_THETB|nr:hypothetical protein AMSG_08249 [Thecamonas trahens ATCC 50062]KNC51997.1 hypothetical protein AMSG_08249 [Thecamonas trahens ATCC 50062]|eukprot:XP_013755581.1 hypothetical protein AMSG_08249 [Thecamonas trahens ATCC 50062]
MAGEGTTEELTVTTVGARVRCKDNTGTVMYYGKVEFVDKVVVGVALDEPLGKHDGSVGGRAYFACKDGHGIFCKVKHLQLLPDVEQDQALSKPAVVNLAPPATPEEEAKLAELQAALGALRRKQAKIAAKTEALVAEYGDAAAIKTSAREAAALIRGLEDKRNALADRAKTEAEALAAAEASLATTRALIEDKTQYMAETLTPALEAAAAELAKQQSIQEER